MSTGSAGLVAVENGRRPRRRYDRSLRDAQAAETRRKIVVAGSEILHQSNVRDWRGLTVRAVAERAGVNERTVYRHFVNERGLRDAVMRRRQEEAGIDLDGMHLEDVADVAARLFEHVSSFPMDPRPELDPTLSHASRQQHAALLAAVETRAASWTEEDRTLAAAVLDVLWSVATYERLVGDWHFDREQAIRATRWVIRMVELAIQEGRRPEGVSATSRSPAKNGSERE